MRLEGKVALVTGASSGIGKAIALLFASEGADIAVNGQDPSKAEATAEAIRKIGRKTITILGNVAEPENVDAIVERTIQELGGVHILVNNAGVPPTGMPTLEEPTVDPWDNVIKVILRGTYLCSQRAGQWMAAHEGGRIINISSVCGIGGFPRYGAYGPAKAGVINMTRLLALEWACHNINVNCIAPGYVSTPMLDSGFEAGVIKEEDLVSQVPLKRLAKPEEIAKTALFLASDDSDYITGTTIPVDGGFLAGGYLGF